MKDEEEAKKVHHIRSLFKPARLFKNHHLHFVSEEMRKDAFVNFPPQLQSSSSLLHMRTYGLSILQFFTHLGRHTKTMRLDVSRQTPPFCSLCRQYPVSKLWLHLGLLLSWLGIKHVSMYLWRVGVHHIQWSLIPVFTMWG